MSLPTPTLPLVALKNSLHSHVLEQSIIAQILEAMRKIPNIDKLKNDMEIVNHVCNLVENMISNNKKANVPLDKKQLVIKILTQLFNLNPSEIQVATTSIDYLVNNNLIVKESLLRKAYNFGTAWAVKKLL